MNLDRGALESIAAAVGLLVLVYMLGELVFLFLHREREKQGGYALDLRVVRMALLGIGSTILATGIIAALLRPLSAMIAAYAMKDAALFQVNTAWYGWIYGLLVYELFYWVQHFLAHKVRLLWCIHSPHHAPRAIHMAIGTNHHFLESVLYFPLFLGALPVLFGVDPIVAVAVNVIDSCWGSFLHISDHYVSSGRYGVIGRFMQTPAHHRVHHAKNSRYMDRNYNSITLFWDAVFGTLEPLRADEPVEFGITRPVDDGSFWDVHFGEFVELLRDMRNASSLHESIAYALHAPGWKPGDVSRPAVAMRSSWLADERERTEARAD
mgnify:FL=1